MCFMYEIMEFGVDFFNMKNCLELLKKYSLKFRHGFILVVFIHPRK